MGEGGPGTELSASGMLQAFGHQNGQQAQGKAASSVHRSPGPAGFKGHTPAACKVPHKPFFLHSEAGQRCALMEFLALRTASMALLWDGTARALKWCI